MSNKQIVNWKVLMLWVTAAAVTSWVLQIAAGSKTLWAIAIVVGALILTSAIAEIEMRMTGKPPGKKNKPRR